MKDILGLSGQTAGIKAVVCDLWGVLHNGRAAYPEAVDALQKLRKTGIFVHLLSNSPRPSTSVAKQIQGFGAPPGCYDALVTSGDLARAFVLDQGAEKTFFHLGPKRDRPTTEGLPNPETDDLRSAGFILCTGFFEDWSMDLKSYEALFAAGIANQTPLVCANPDKEVDIGAKRVACAGALAGLYESMGGTVHWFGKPYAVAYEACFAAMKKHLPALPEASEILAIGDNLETDILGGLRQGMKTLFISEGLHGHRGTTVSELEPFMKTLDIFPDLVMKRLKW